MSQNALASESIVRDLYSRIEELTTKNNNLETVVQNLESQISQNHVIAFTVMDLQRTDGIRSGQTVRYANTLLNIGGYYNSATYRFTCPVHGLYVFSVTFTTASGTIDRVILRKNGQQEFTVYASDDPDNGSYGSGTASVVMECNVNEFVDVAAGQAGNFYSGLNVHFFSGFFLTSL